VRQVSFEQQKIPGLQAVGFPINFVFHSLQTRRYVEEPPRYSDGWSLRTPHRHREPGEIIAAQDHLSSLLLENPPNGVNSNNSHIDPLHIAWYDYARWASSYLVISNPFFPNHEPGQAPGFIHGGSADVMLTGGMGGRAVSFFEQYGIQPVTGAAGTVRQALECFQAGQLGGYAPCGESVAHGHGHDHGHAGGR
jgi:predicted Fe-Mo cluster-binding NifX family protein